MQMQYPCAVREILDGLHEAGYEAYIVGGSLRDTLLGREPHDWDVTTSALPEQTLSVFRHRRTILTGIKHGTVTVLAEENGTPLPVEVTTYRIDGDYLDARHPSTVTFTPNIADDLSRRDFTVCAMAWSPYGEGDGLVDLFGGREDLDARLIRCVGEPEMRFREDALRILRAYRFAAQLSFDIDPATRAGARVCAPLLARISVERITAELSRTVTSPNAAAALTMMIEDGVLGRICTDLDQSGIPRLAALPPELALRLAALFRRTPVDRVNGVLTGLRFPGTVVRRVCAALALCDVPMDRDAPLGVRRLLRAGGQAAVTDSMTLRGAFGEDVSAYRLALARSLERGDCTDLAHLALSGGDLAELGVPRGPDIGRILGRLLDAVIEDPTQNEKEKLLTLAKTML
ncbi:MAG: polynucleotide adenylyltransferase [Ruminococcaceae bacterium]|nr:polynucleotide adenylyltransferase [Oscillospiraceae bacterium]